MPDRYPGENEVGIFYYKIMFEKLYLKRYYETSENSTYYFILPTDSICFQLTVFILVMDLLKSCGSCSG